MTLAAKTTAVRLAGSDVAEAALPQDIKPKEEFIMVIDADSILRMPFYPEQFNVTRGALPVPVTLL